MERNGNVGAASGSWKEKIGPYSQFPGGRGRKKIPKKQRQLTLSEVRESVGSAIWGIGKNLPLVEMN